MRDIINGPIAENQVRVGISNYMKCSKLSNGALEERCITDRMQAIQLTYFPHFNQQCFTTRKTNENKITQYSTYCIWKQFSIPPPQKKKLEGWQSFLRNTVKGQHMVCK